MERPKIKRRERDTIIQALRAGVVPKLGLRHIQVGRAREVAEMVRDVERIAEGGAAIRFVIGEYGSGKTFFLNLVRLIALEKGMVVLSADLAPDRRIQATGGQARSLYAELTRNASTRTKPEGGALASVVERFVTQAVREADSSERTADAVIRDKLEHLEELTGGYDFATVIAKYWEGHEAGDDELKSNALRWLRAEFATKTDARRALGVRTMIDDAGVYDHLKLMSAFVREAGYAGLLVELDELVNLYKLTNSQARNANYEQILRILNDVLQGSAAHLGFMLGGTPEFLMDTRRGTVQLRSSPVAARREHVCKRRAGRSVRASPAPVQPDAGGTIRAACQCQARLPGRRDRRRAGRRPQGVHGALLAADWRRLFPNTENYGHRVREHALDNRAESGDRVARPDWQCRDRGGCRR